MPKRVPFLEGRCTVLECIDWKTLNFQEKKVYEKWLSVSGDRDHGVSVSRAYRPYSDGWCF